MLRPTAFVLILGVWLGTVSCRENQSSLVAEPTHTPELHNRYEAVAKRATAISSMFPDPLAGYTRKSHKTKPKDWGHAHSATYIRKKDELKIVVNDAPPTGRDEWAVFFQDGKTYKGFPVAVEKKPGKLTLMVRVDERFRVDFKTRTMTEDLLRKAAEDFDFRAVQKLLRLEE